MLFWLQAGTEQEAVSLHEKKKKNPASAAPGPFANTRTQACTALAPEPEPLLQGVTFLLDGRPHGPVPGSVAALGRRWHLLHHQGGSRPTLHRPVCQLAANTSRPASTGIPNRDKSGALGEAGWN